MQGMPMLTDNGKNILSKSIANKVPIILSSMALGDGISSNIPITEMINIVLKKEIENYSYDNGQAYVRSTFTNENLSEGFYIREIGIYAVDPDNESELLFAYISSGDNEADYFSPGTGKVILKEIIELATGFSGSQDIHLTIDSSAAMVTVDEFNSKVSEINQVVAEKANKTDIPTSLPANGGNADTVGGKLPSSFSPAGHTHNKADVGLGNVDNTADANKSVNYASSAGSATNATNAGNSDTVDGWHVNLAIGGWGIKPICAGTGDMVAGTTGLSQGHVYIVYE